MKNIQLIEPTALDATALYFGDNGRAFCGHLNHSGATAYYTGRDISGQKVVKVSEEDHAEFTREGLILACESCASAARKSAK